MDANPEDGKKVRLRADRLAELMEEGGWSPQRLHSIAGEPSKRSINRWLRQGSGSADGLVTTEWRYVTAVADALGVSPLELVDTAETASGGEIDRWLRLAAALGPRVYPGMLAHLGFHGVHVDDRGSDAFLLRVEGAAVETYRFVRWTHCEDILKDDTWLPPEYARAALEWANEHGLTIEEAPELHCLANLAIGEAELAWRAGKAWMSEASRRNVQAEFVWVGERIVRSPSPQGPDSAALEVDVRLSYARGLRLAGRPERGLEVLADVSLMTLVHRAPLMSARLAIELGRTRTATGRAGAALPHLDQAIAQLACAESNQETVDAMVDAHLARHHALQMQGDSAAAIAAHEALERYARAEPRVSVSRFYRQRAGAAFERGEIAAALSDYQAGLDAAMAESDLREVLMAQINVAIAHALLGHDEQARSYFEQSVASAASGEAGPLSVATINLNFGEFALEHGWFSAARRHLQVALQQSETAGDFPFLRSRSSVLLAETLAALGEVADARRAARDAYKDALLCQSPADEAMALVALALCHMKERDLALSWTDAAEARLDALPARSAYTVSARIRRRIAEVRHLLGATRTARASLERLRAQALRAGLQSEVNALDRLLSARPPEHVAT
ncbi:MAG: hypothetical protein H6744_10255 [Deltaproteobacteria bacterium]|nr:hypothetical protein [Deltaproteobacteria bacterium]MCB9787059.1 hypothetical protein [Deltaproteobacteria bacterium]